MEINKQIALALTLSSVLALSACGTWWLPRPHKIDIQQGNLLSAENVAQITIGMSRSQVVSILGRPLTDNHLNPNRWEYIFSENRSGEKPKAKRISVDFENDQVANIDKAGWE